MQSYFRMKYIVALAIIALMSITSWWLLDSLIASKKQDASIINIAGQQRMLSQRITLLVLNLISENDPDLQELNADDLRISIEKFERNHHFLTSLEQLPDEIQVLYSDKAFDLNGKSYRFTKAARIQLSAYENNDPDVEPWPYNQRNIDALLKLLDTVVQLFEKQAAMRAEQIQQFETATLIIILLVLLIEGVFVFEPLRKQIIWQFNELESKTAAAETSQQKAVEATKDKAAFIAHMVHALRTPLNNVLGMIDLAIYTPSKKEHFLEKAKDAGNQLMYAIEEVLDFEKIETSKLLIKTESVHIERFINLLEKDTQTLCHDAGLGLTFSKPDNLTCCVMIDEFRLRQILSNLIGNAVKYTPEGMIQINFKLEDSGDNKALMHFSITDTGIGMTEEYMSQLFEIGSDYAPPINRKSAGIGLSLLVSKRLVEKMNGQFFIQSHFGKGTTITITMPVDISGGMAKSDQQVKADKTEAIPQAKNFTVLVVDDNDISLEIMQSILQDFGFNVILANNGADAIMKLNNSEVHFMFVDIHMPILGGIELAEGVREFNPDIPIYALTADVMQASQNNCINAGMNGVLIKPIDKAAVLNVLCSNLPLQS